jgi:WD40 repeat protein
LILINVLELQNLLSTDVQVKKEDIVRAITSLHNSLLISNKVDPRGVYGMSSISPIQVLHGCCYHWDIPVEIRMIIGQYVLLKTELSHDSSYEGHTNAVNTLVVCESANRLFSGSYESSIKVWDTIAGTCLTSVQGNCVYVYLLKNTDCFLDLVTRLSMYGTQWHGSVFILEHADTVRYLVLDESSDRLYSASWDETIKIWDLHTLTCIRTLEGHSGWIDSLCLSLTSNRLYSGSWDNTIKVWNTISYECMCTMAGHSDFVNSLCLFEDGSRLYSGSGDKTIKVWDTANNTCITTLEGHTNAVTSLSLF